MELFLTGLGVNLQALIGGFAGAVVAALVVGSRNPIEILAACVVGALTANYVAPVAASYVGVSNNLSFSAFFVGAGAKHIVQALIDKAKQFSMSAPGRPGPNTGGSNAP